MKFTAANDSAELIIYDPIGASFWEETVSAKDVLRRLGEAGNVKDITVRINSPGGSVFDGSAIYNSLKSHAARVTVHVDGEASSIASLIAMAASPGRLFMAQASWMMIHEARGGRGGTAEELRKTADVIDGMNDVLATAYAARTGRTPEDIRVLMRSETWMTAKEAVEMGFADSVTDSQRIAASRESADFSARHFIRVPHAALAPINGVENQNNAVPAGENRNMSLKLLLASALGLDANADDASFERGARNLRALASSVETATGKTGSEAVGVIQAWKQSHDTLPAAQARLAELETSAEAREIDNVIAAGKEAKKLTPAAEARIRDLYAKRDITLAGARAMVETMLPVQALASNVEQPVINTGASAGSSDADAKRWNEMKPQARADLKRTDPATYNALRSAAGLR